MSVSHGWRGAVRGISAIAMKKKRPSAAAGLPQYSPCEEHQRVYGYSIRSEVCLCPALKTQRRGDMLVRSLVMLRGRSVRRMCSCCHDFLNRSRQACWSVRLWRPMFWTAPRQAPTASGDGCCKPSALKTGTRCSPLAGRLCLKHRQRERQKRLFPVSSARPARKA